MQYFLLPELVNQQKERLLLI